MKNNNFSFFKFIVIVFMIIPCIFALSACDFSICSHNTPTISISSDGYWVINGEKTAVKAEGKDGKDGQDADNYTIKDVYDTLVSEENYTGSFSDFIKEYYSTDLTSEISKICKPSVVSVTRKNSTKTGSGVIFEKDENGNAYIITNYHVVYPSPQTEEFRLYLANDDAKSNVIIATYVAGNENKDLAILKVENNETIKTASVATFANKNASDGETCLAIGNTHSKGIAITLGTVSKEIDNCSYSAGSLGSISRTVLRHCAYIEKGSSGGGLFNLRGELIGITNAGESGETTLMNYAIPIEIVTEFINEVFNN